MKKFALTAAAAAAALAVTGTAHAGSPDGKIQVKVLATAVLPNGKIDFNKSVTNIGPILNATNDTKANDNVVPTVAIEYFFSENISVETICCLTGHHVSLTGSPSAEHLIDHVLVLPATLTVKAHLPLGMVKPYIGAGVTEFFFLGEHGGSDIPGIDAKIDNTFGAVVQAGVDIPVNANGMSVSLDAKRYFVRPRSHFYSGGLEVISAEHKLDPWVLSAGVAYRF